MHHSSGGDILRLPITTSLSFLRPPTHRAQHEKGPKAIAG
ncbi:hypothetical protein BofuT4_uP052230.1 [Botrytis cinerea T4]|uniref:Uncharacterized protein n=1 Tax=Botryotinia fuckeliana (strain T4) TaxID=999810 RepID=G2XWK4_BOTF4|nr:hypothetical protein BofuT4_uP052230.1 [Botrytis cinerea T4]